MIYSIVRYHVERGQNTLIVVPTTSLVEQMYKDFEDYGWDVGSYCHKIYAGRERRLIPKLLLLPGSRSTNSPESILIDLT